MFVKSIYTPTCHFCQQKKKQFLAAICRLKTYQKNFKIFHQNKILLNNKKLNSIFEMFSCSQKVEFIS